MKKILFMLMLSLSACMSKDKQAIVVTDTTAVNNNIDTIKKDTQKPITTKKKSIEQNEDDRLDDIMNRRKNVK